jgi:hypothetical protein
MHLKNHIPISKLVTKLFHGARLQTYSKSTICPCGTVGSKFAHQQHLPCSLPSGTQGSLKSAFDPTIQAKLYNTCGPRLSAGGIEWVEIFR